MHLGTREDGAARRVWIAMSQPQDRRRRARLAANVKRLYPTVGGGRQGPADGELSTGSAWVDGVKVCSGSVPRPGGTEDAGAGWADLNAIAAATRNTKEEIDRVWAPLTAELN